MEASLIALTGFLFPIKLTLGYIGLIPLICWWLSQNYTRLSRYINGAPRSLKSLLAFFAVATGTSLFGIDPANSFLHIGTLIFFPLTIFCFRDYSSRHQGLMIGSLLSGSVLSAVLVLFQSLSSTVLPIIGPVSQSGQLAILFFVALFAAIQYPKQIALISVSIGLIVLALVINLKRGPWMGVAVSVALLLLCRQNRRSLLLFLLTVSLLATSVPLISDRLASSINHFFISGGRSEIWSIGVELISKYPLGIGFDNSDVLREFSAEVPKNLKHFHSNYLNIFVETGYLGIALFGIFLVTLGKEIASVTGYGGEQKNFEILVLSCGVLAWAIAGTVEYNFGDSAVVSILYIVLGILYRTFETRITQDLAEKS